MDETNEALSTAMKASILRGFTAREAELRPADGSIDRTWRWADGAVLFPEARCPLCQSAMRSNCIWMINRESRELLGQRRLVGGRIVTEQPNHPHVNGTGVCTGSTNDVVTALFLSMYPGDSYWGSDTSRLKRWLESHFDHVCGQPNHVANPAACECEAHQLERGGIVRCETCRATYAAGSEHTHRNPAVPCGCCYCIPAAGACGCGHEACWCDSYAEGNSDDEDDDRSFYCDWCEESDSFDHDHDLRTCVECAVRFDHDAVGCHCCDNCDANVCGECPHTCVASEE